MARQHTHGRGGDGDAPEMWRLFVAIDIGADARAALGAVQECCREAGFPLRPVDLAGAHLTLRFLGATDPARIPALGAALQSTAATHDPFVLHTAAPGVFPSVARPRVLWLGLDGAVGCLSALQREVEEALTGCGVAREARPFAPHLTIGRLAATPPPASQTAALLAALPVAATPLPLTAIHLLRSVLGPAGPRYTTLLTAPLRGAL